METYQISSLELKKIKEMVRSRIRRNNNEEDIK